MTANADIVMTEAFRNEELALRFQSGDQRAAEFLISRNEGYLTKRALRFSERCDLEDLKQEGTLALLEAAARFAPSHGTTLLTYATPAIEAAMTDYAAQQSLSLSIPTGRYLQLCKVAKICGEVEDESEPAILDAICTELEVTPKIAAALLEEHRNLFCAKSLYDGDTAVSYGDDPARIYDRKMREALLLQLMEDTLKPRELNLVQSYLGIGQSDGERMTFQELAIRLNYNSPSGAEKAYKAAIRKLKKEIHSSAYGQWISIQKAIHKARAKVEADSGYYTTPQTTWLDEKELVERFIGKVVSLNCIHELFSNASENERK